MLNAIYELKEGWSPLIVSMPHSGLELPDDMRNQLTDHALTLPDTDWHIPQLYGFLQELDVTRIKANLSRYVVDLNRSANNDPLYPGQASTDVCPVTTFAGEPLYREKSIVTDDVIADRIDRYWHPYHTELKTQIERVTAKHGYAIIYDAHSIRSEVPRLFQGVLPDLNLGTAGGQSTDQRFQLPIEKILAESDFHSVVNGRFVGGYITRHYGVPENNIHTIQMEIAQHSYMDEESFQYLEEKAARLTTILEQVIKSLLN